MRGTMKSFFRTFKRLCRYFAGHAFKDVVEKGDYPAEQMASLVVEQVQMAAVRFIVDYYHHRKHRGLEGGTPYGRWLELSGKGMPPDLPAQQLKVAFGFRAKRAISKHGIESLGLSYNSNPLAFLHGLVGAQRVDTIVDAEDLDVMLVYIPKKYRGRIKQVPEDQVYLEVPSVDGCGNGKTLVDLLQARKEVRELVRKEQEAGRTFRLNAHRDFLELSQSAMKAAGLPSHELTQKQFDMVLGLIERSGRAGLGSVEYGSEETDDQDLGEPVAVSKRSRIRSAEPAIPLPSPSSIRDMSSQPAKPAPFGGSINLYKGDQIDKS